MEHAVDLTEENYCLPPSSNGFTAHPDFIVWHDSHEQILTYDELTVLFEENISDVKAQKQHNCGLKSKFTASEWLAKV